MPATLPTHPQPKLIALIGARGHTGAELIRLIDRHPRARLALASSRELAGESVAAHVQGVATDLLFENIHPGDLAIRSFDCIILALPNGTSGPYVDAIERAGAEIATGRPCIIDISADHRFDDSRSWVYGLPEHFREHIKGARRIANPGCYATAMQVALRPVLDLLDRSPHVFGVSGYSGAGTTPSERNDPARLHNNLLPYALIGHTHEREATRHLGHPIRFMPHVAPFFRGITLTISMELNATQSMASLRQRFDSAYRGEPLVEWSDPIPEVRDIANKHTVRLGGLAVDEAGRHAVIVATIDNLLKGAATQAIQNLNLAMGFGELEGIEVER